MDIEQFRRAGHEAIDRICEYYYTLQDRPVTARVEPGYLRRALPSEAPQSGENFDLITQDYEKYIMPGLTLWHHPSFFAYFPTGSTFEAVLGDLYSGSVPNPGFNWSASPASTELETVVMDWAAKMLGLDSSFHNCSKLLCQTTASESALVAVVAARSRYTKQHPDVSSEKLLIYITTQTHSLGKKAGLVLGLNVRALEVTVEDNFALRGDTLRRALEDDCACWATPICSELHISVGTVGTTSSGAVDCLGEIGLVLEDYPFIWLHYRDVCALGDINKYGDSFCTNFHKWGLVNVDCSGFWVRARASLIDALDVTPEFLRTRHGDAGTVIDYRNWHFGLCRKFRSLKLWFVLRSFGVEGFQRYIRETVKLGNMFASLIRESAEFALVTPPSLALTVFRLEPYFPSSVPPAKLNELNREFYARVSARSDIAFTQTDLSGTFCVRMAVGAIRTSEDHIKRAFEILCLEGRAALEEWRCATGGIE
ncbi:pyridoxal phosphate-dependent transferase [Pisolithus orientalis]|uniref:pyridoxal phosphate-dependent transferase n=1 Tax=Pisolithus orientalis TaxID=936130 RepID=UPI0022253BEA|nr:pyridoxal phosphate-dependent transferase [Pisolithus orientalis]KAI6007661.1 pyridoxal phosphate-dependent transferase [Pisolithus orientalis]